MNIVRLIYFDFKEQFLSMHCINVYEQLQWNNKISLIHSSCQNKFCLFWHQCRVMLHVIWGQRSRHIETVSSMWRNNVSPSILLVFDNIISKYMPKDCGNSQALFSLSSMYHTIKNHRYHQPFCVNISCVPQLNVLSIEF